MPALASGRYHIKWTQLADLPVPLYGTHVAVQHTIRSMSLAIAQFQMLYIRCMSMTLILTNGVSCHHQVIASVFFTSLVES